MSFFSRSKTWHWKTAKFKWLCRVLLDFLSAQTGQGGCRCQPSICFKQDGGELSSGNFPEGPSFPNHLLPCLSQTKAPQNCKNILNKIILEMFPSVWGAVIVIWPVFFYFKKLSEQSLRNCCENLGCPVCAPALNNTSCCCGAFVTPWARTWLAARSSSPQVLHLETPDVHRACTGEVESRSKWFKTEKGNRETLVVYALCRVHLGGNKRRKIIAVLCSCQCWTNSGIFKKYWFGTFKNVVLNRG